MRRIALAALSLVLLTGLGLPSVALGTPEPRRDRERPERTPRPDRTQRPDRTASPTEEPGTGPVPVAVPPSRTALTVGYRESGILGQAPLLVAREAGYFTEAGFDEVRIVEVADTLADVRNGELDLGVVDAREAARLASGEDTTLRAVAGFRNHAEDGTYGGDLLLAAPGLVADEPATVTAFLAAYVRALHDLSDPDSAAEALALIEATDLVVDPALAADWAGAVSVFAPFDGGFGDLAQEGGLGELDAYLADGGIEVPDPSYFIAAHTLNIAQALVGLPANPVSDLAGPPGLAEVRIGMAPTPTGSLPMAAATENGYFADAGFDSVSVIEVEEPLLGLLNGELELGIVRLDTAAEGVAQGLPLLVLAGHVNAAGERDVLAASADLVSEEGSTVAAFLIAYLRGLRDLAADPDAAAYAPFDGGFGDRALDGGVAELGVELAEVLGAEPDLGALLADRPLEYAQAWWGLPANPIRSPQAAGEEGA